ncbi:MAG TPA: TIGR03557 family F420-dependent LLM class oxidoreductase [Candidatus Binatia bacterium]|jgi:G6PDH family F420-dependent oxidoreductase|nr:TIGR03557 family F420-dependent LLM class oxidoreductase [Candidatus Binatia bacterium]
MAKIGYALSSEENSPNDLIRYAKLAEQIGFDFALISDHYHPWISHQGHSSFVWSVIGGISQVTHRLSLGTGVTCPTVRIHPAIIAQAAATAALMMPGRFFLGLGTGEALNEHILGCHWPPVEIRKEMLEEAVEILRLLWKGGKHSFRGRYYTVEEAQIFSLPPKPPPIVIAAAAANSAEMAGRIGEGLISTVAQANLVTAFRSAGADKPCYGQVTVCWAEKEDTARQTALEWWPVTAIPGKLMSELPTPGHFEQAVELVTEDAVAAKIVCGPDPSKHIEKINQFIEAGFDHVYVHQVGPNQEGFFRFYEREVLPRLD